MDQGGGVGAGGAIVAPFFQQDKHVVRLAVAPDEGTPGHVADVAVERGVIPVGERKRFFTALGYSFNPQFTDEKAGCLVISDTIYAMLLQEPFFKTFTRKQIADSTKTTEAIVALEVESRERVDELVDKALAAGGQPSMETNDHGFMYERSFQDPDGHLWAVLWMDPAAVQS